MTASYQTTAEGPRPARDAGGNLISGSGPVIKHVRLAPPLQDVRATHTSNTMPIQTVMPN